MGRFSKIAFAIGVVAFVAAAFVMVFYRPALNSLTARPSAAPDLRIGIVNVSVLKERAKVYIEFEKLIDDSYRRENKEFLEKETELRNEFNDLKKLWPDSTGTAPEKYVKRKQDLDKRVDEAQQLMMQRKEALKKLLTSHVERIESTIIQIIHDIGVERNLQLVLNATMEHAKTSLVLYGGKDLDITEEVLNRLDKKLPSLEATGN